MIRIKKFDYRCGGKIISQNIIDEIEDIFLNEEQCVSKDTIKGIKKTINNDLLKKGWVPDYRLDVKSRITISFYFNHIGMCFQTGNVGRMYADLLKLQALFIKGNIEAGIIIVPQRSTANMLAQNMANYERLIGELKIFKQVITIPLVIVGFGGMEE